MTCDGFCGLSEEHHQSRAKETFVNQYLDAEPNAREWAAQHLSRHDIWVRSLKDDDETLELGHSLEDGLQRMFESLDEFFFFGTLSRPHRVDSPPFVFIESGYLYCHGQFKPGCLGVAFRGPAESGAQLIIKIFTALMGTNKRSLSESSWPTIVTTLIHEMVHVYLALFICRRGKCREVLIKTFGITGHGPAFLALEGLILKKIKEWHPSLKSLGDMCLSDPQRTVSLRSWQVECKKLHELGLSWEDHLQHSPTSRARLVYSDSDEPEYVTYSPPAKSKKKINTSSKKKIKSLMESEWAAMRFWRCVFVLSKRSTKERSDEDNGEKTLKYSV
ncbi:hypothetical protein CTRI78_v002350 [Colletotrichum trifolii]|uniref:SprT-like domain-containing protein n=1 Tax=Colletotrichum trifolii TaxID=5466 RepID=A0A4R8RLZ3_COLTR|nr:hypothetical protein CTRI78_v002350 [Colletotrichum trifolii]